MDRAGTPELLGYYVFTFQDLEHEIKKTAALLQRFETIA